MNLVATWLISRLNEPSTWAGLALIANGLQHGIASGDWGSIASAAGGGLAVIISEGRSSPRT